MTEMIVIGALVLYLASAVLAYGITLAYFQTQTLGDAQKNYREDMGTATTFALFGPIGLLVALLQSGFVEHGLQYRRKARG